MSSENDSYASTPPRIRQFGLYKGIDSKTEEFLRLSRKRQIRQGCACAAVSTAITVTVVIVILLIYEYAIAVEWSLVQRIKTNAKNITHDTPFADRLDRNFFGFDQEYYERMPLLVNALQESNYDSAIEMTKPNKIPYELNRTFVPNIYGQNRVSKSSPRPFIFEYRSATPLPFSKKYGSRSWVDSYRNAQRLANIRQVIRYLEKTINAKSADMHTKPTNSHTSIAFSGVYVEPKIEKDKPGEPNTMEPVQQNSNRVETYANHNEDPLFNFKPDSPGEVNLLADTYYRFPPVATPSILPDMEPNKVPMFRRVPYRNFCRENNCNKNVDNPNKFKSLNEHHTEPPSSTKSFSVMLNLFPMNPNIRPEPTRYDDKTNPPLEKIYLTTSKPLIQFRRKPITMRRAYVRYKKPKYLTRNGDTSANKPIFNTVELNDDQNKNSTMIVHVDVYSPENKSKSVDHRPYYNQNRIRYTTSTLRPTSVLPVTEKPVKLLAGQVEDYHDGSSGLITIKYPDEITEATTQATSQTTMQTPTQQATSVVPFFDTTTEQNPWATSPPDVMKFGVEDAKVPEHYITLPTTQTIQSVTDINNINWQTTTSPYDFNRKMDTYSTQMDITKIGNNLNFETTQPYDVDMGKTESTTEMDRRKIHLETTQSVPMETVKLNMDWLTTQRPDYDESNDEVNDDSEPETTEPNKMERGRMKWVTTTIAPTEIDQYGSMLRKTIKDLRDRLIIKLKNRATSTERPNQTTTEKNDETTQNTYVPQINGHSRNIFSTKNQTRYTPETYRKRKLEMSVTGFRSYVPMYTEIRRNSKSSDETIEMIE